MFFFHLCCPRYGILSRSILHQQSECLRIWFHLFQDWCSVKRRWVVLALQPLQLLLPQDTRETRVNKCCYVDSQTRGNFNPSRDRVFFLLLRCPGMDLCREASCSSRMGVRDSLHLFQDWCSVKRRWVALVLQPLQLLRPQNTMDTRVNNSCYVD